MKRSPVLRNKSRRSKRLRRFRLVLILALGFSLLQYLHSGTVSWPEDLVHKVTASLSDYATRSDASWRRATDQLEEIGAAREGQPIPEFDFTGRVVRVADGDTVSVLDKANTQHKVRLYGIDTPERDQPYGISAKNALVHLVDEKHVGVVVVDTDSYDRSVGTLYRDGININAAMIAGGHAWWYQHYAPHERILAAAESQARTKGLGLWASPHPVPPWKWRRGQR